MIFNQIGVDGNGRITPAEWNWWVDKRYFAAQPVFSIYNLNGDRISPVTTTPLRLFALAALATSIAFSWPESNPFAPECVPSR